LSSRGFPEQQCGFPCNKTPDIAFVPVQGAQEEIEMISAKVILTQALQSQRQFIAETGSGHHIVLDDAAGATGAKPIELVAVALAGCTAFDVVTMLRQKHHQKLTGYEVHVEADQAERPPQVFTAIRLRHVLTGFAIDKSAVEQAIQLSEGKYCSVGAMLKESATLETLYEIHEEPSSWLQSAPNPERVTA
jgi:putative redox protein